MSEISEQAKLKACELANAEKPHDRPFMPTDTGYGTLDALAHHLDRAHEAWAACLDLLDHHDNCTAPTDRDDECSCGLMQVRALMAPFILPEPIDPLEHALADASLATGCGPREGAKRLHEQLRLRGLKIVPADA